MITKYILKEVLFYKEKYKDQIEITRLVSNKNYIEYTSEVTGNPYNYITHDKINVYELAHKCKEWALNKGYYLRAEQGFNYKDNLQWTAFLNTNMDDGADYVDYWNNTEPEAIFKACEWILKQKENNE